MTKILLLVISIFCFLFQVVFSIYYSIGIVDISTKVNQVQKELEASQIEVQKIKTGYYKLISLNSLKNDPSTILMTPITKTIPLSP